MKKLNQEACEKFIYEYKVCFRETDTYGQQLQEINEIAKDGWRLVTIVGQMYYFERPKFIKEEE